MKKIFFDKELLKKGLLISINGNDYHHLANVLRVRLGENFIIGDRENNEFIGIIEKIDNKNISLQLKDIHYREEYRYPEVTLFFTVLKGDKNEEIIRKCTEIGVDNFVPVITRNTVVKTDEENSTKKINKWKNIIRESSMQCGRLKLPEIFPILEINDLNKVFPENLKIIGLIEKNRKSLKDFLDEQTFSPKKISIFIGPEGDLTKEEIINLTNNGWQGVRFTNNVLKSETACIYAASSIFFYYGGVI